MADWKEEARGIPVWAGALFYDGDSAFTRICDDAEHGMVLFCDGACAPAKRCAVALDNPDTRAAFVRRLAIRLGASEKAAAEGVRFYWEGANEEWTLEAGYYHQWYATFEPKDGFPVGVNGDSGELSLLALVRAWRSVVVIPVAHMEHA